MVKGNKFKQYRNENNMSEVEKIIKIAEQIKDKCDIEEVLIDISIINKVMFGNYTESSKIEIYNEIRKKYSKEIAVIAEIEKKFGATENNQSAYVNISNELQKLKLCLVKILVYRISKFKNKLSEKILGCGSLQEMLDFLIEITGKTT